MYKLLILLTLLNCISCSTTKFGKEKSFLFKPLHSEVQRSRIGYFHKAENCFEAEDVDSREIITVPIKDYQIAVYHFADRKITWDVKVVTTNGVSHKEYTPVDGARFEVEVVYCKIGPDPFDTFGTTYASFRLAN